MDDVSMQQLTLWPVCECGCGEEPARARRTYNAARIKKGEHRRFVSGHQHRGPMRWRTGDGGWIAPTLEDKAWAAGFYEGEGSVLRHRHTLRVSLPQVNTEPLEWLQARWGGSLAPPVPSRSLSVWYISGGNARAFMQDIYPLLSLRRREQAETAGWKTG